jgi:hypothetical protein
MVGIEGMKMPDNCISCPFIKAEGTKFFCSRIMKYIDKNDIERKRDDCPLVDIVIDTCKSPVEDIKRVKEGGRMNITDINFAIDVLSHPQSVDKSDINKALNIAIELLKTGKEIVERECALDKIRERIELEKLGYHPSAGYYRAIMKCLQIIDKYKESNG